MELIAASILLGLHNGDDLPGKILKGVLPH